MIAIFPELASAAVAGNIEELAILVRRYFGGEEARVPKPDIARIMAVAGIQLVRSPIDSLAAIAVDDTNGRFRIVLFIGDRLNPYEERFAISHCLGHIFLEIQPRIAAGQAGKLGFKEVDSPMRRYISQKSSSEQLGSNNSEEHRADHFAAALLLPQGMVIKACEALADYDTVANFFGVTSDVVLARLRQLNVLSRPPVSFLDGERQILGKVADPVLSSGGPLNLDRLNAPIKSPESQSPLMRQQARNAVKAARQPPAVSPITKDTGASARKNPDAQTPKQLSSIVPDATSGAQRGPTSGLSRIRRLAQLIDGSVKVE